MCEHWHGRRLLNTELACHKCDVRNCVARDHLWIGDNAANIADREAKGRNIVKCGEEHGCSILKESDVIEIKHRLKREYKRRCPLIKILAIQYGVSRDLIFRIHKGTLWKHVLIGENDE